MTPASPSSQHSSPSDNDATTRNTISQDQGQGQVYAKEPDSYSYSNHQIANNLMPFKQGTCSIVQREEDQVFAAKIHSKIEHLSGTGRLQPQLIILYSELLSEIVRVIPSAIASRGARGAKNLLHDTAIHEQINENNLQVRPHPNILTIVISPKPDNHIKTVLAEPFQLDLFDRKHLIDIQIENTPCSLKKILLMDDTWAQLQDKAGSTMSWQSTDAAREHHVQLLKQESSRVENILSTIAATPNLHLGPMELVCVLDQSESELYGVPAGIRGKVIFVVSKDREERPKAVVHKTNVHWIDRIFLRADYSLDWIHASVIPLYIELPEGPKLDLAGQRPESAFEGVGIRLSAKRPIEAYTRVKVRQGQGAEVLEWSVLEEIERTRIFEMQAIRKPLIFQLMEDMSLDNKIVGSGKAGQADEAIKTERDENPFL